MLKGLVKYASFGGIGNSRGKKKLKGGNEVGGDVRARAKVLKVTL